MDSKVVPVLFTLTIILISGLPISPVFANSIDPLVTDKLFFTTFSGGQNVHEVDIAFDGATFTLGTPNNLCSTNGADGISVNPQNTDLLLIGGQGPRINTCDITNGNVVEYPSPETVFHLEVSDPNTVYGTAIPGSMARHVIMAGGSLDAGTSIALVGDDNDITQLITTPSGFFYARSFFDASGGHYGTASIVGTTATLSQMYGPVGSISTSNVPVHGGLYDPFTNTVITVGSSQITQFDLLGTIISQLNLPAGITTTDASCNSPRFDQASVDGNGHLFIADNVDGCLYFIDYAASGFVGTAGFTDAQFLASQLDDVAPLIVPQIVGGVSLSIDTTALILAGAQTNALWIMSALAVIGSVAFGAIYITSRKN